jgi:hypothetical protein
MKAEAKEADESNKSAVNPSNDLLGLYVRPPAGIQAPAGDGSAFKITSRA